MNIKKTALIGILAAVICILAPLSFPAGAIPISLSTFAVYIISCTVSRKHATLTIIIYILLGAAGLPVFSSFSGGFHCLTSVTGGYIIGYIPCAYIIGLLTDKFENKKIVYPLSMILGTAVCYLCGTLWFMHQTQTDLSAALAACTLPFIIGDAIKITAASCIGITLHKRLKNYII